MMNRADQIKLLFDRYVMPTYGRFPLTIVRGIGCRVWDANGTEYLDFAAGIAVCTLGHAHPGLAQALATQANTLVHTSNLYLTEPQAMLARKLVEMVGEPGKCFFCNSGGEANEALFKLARKFGSSTGGARYEIITFENSFHGRTLAGIAATGQQKVKQGFEPPVAGFVHVPYNNLEAVRAAIKPQTAAILVEPIQGESGIMAADPGFLTGLRRLCDEKNLLLFFDEVQCGLGRTGDWCAFKTLLSSGAGSILPAAADYFPDAISWAKGIAGGVPMGAIWVRQRNIALADGSEKPLCDVLGPGTHATTFGGTPLACAAALAVLETIENDDLLANARKVGAYARTQLSNLDSRLLKEIRGVGLMIGIELATNITDLIPSLQIEGKTPAALFVERLHGKGLLAVPAGTHVIRWLPPLNVTNVEVDEAIEKLRLALIP
jgi:acetylornithine aminotransferase/acetylornithine/N-succinyldiaminopimelate aminotransferase